MIYRSEGLYYSSNYTNNVADVSKAFDLSLLWVAVTNMKSMWTCVSPSIIGHRHTLAWITFSESEFFELKTVLYHWPPAYCMLVFTVWSYNLLFLWRHSFSSWAHHSVVLQQLQPRFLQMSSIWLQQQADWITGGTDSNTDSRRSNWRTSEQRGHRIFSAHKHQHGQPGLSHWNDLLKDAIPSTTIRIY